MLCRPEPSSKSCDKRNALPRQAAQSRRWHRLAGVVMLCSVVSWTAAQASMPAANSLESLHRELRQWVASTQGVEPDSVQVATGDARLRIPTCEKPVQFDYPFSNRQNVRARCEQPNWQHYLQISLRNGTTTSPAVPGAIGLVPRQVLVSPQMLKRGTVLQPGMLKTAEVAMPPSESQVLPPQQSVSNMELVRDLPANTPLRSYDLKPSLLVRRGQQVLVNVGEGRGFLITVRAEAQQDGMLGEQIRLKNTESGRLLSAVVTGVNLARGL